MVEREGPTAWPTLISPKSVSPQRCPASPLPGATVTACSPGHFPFPESQASLSTEGAALGCCPRTWPSGCTACPSQDVPPLPTALPVIRCPPTLHAYLGASVTRHTRATATKLNFSVVTKDDIGQLPAFKVFSHVTHPIPVMSPQHSRQHCCLFPRGDPRTQPNRLQLYRAARGSKARPPGA